MGKFAERIHLYINLIIVGTILSLCHLQSAFASSGITYHGRLLNPDGTAVDSSTVQFRMQIRTPGIEDCLLYEEIQTLDLSTTSGMFALSLADGSGVRQDSNTWTLFEALANRKPFSFTAGDCVGVNNYTPVATDNRKFRVYFNDGTFPAGTWEALPVQTINFIPMAIESYAVGGFPASSLLRVETAGVLGTTTPLTSTQYNEILSLVAGTSSLYEKDGELNGSALPTISSGESVRWNGSAWQSFTPLTSETDPNVEAFAKSSLPTCAAGEVLKSDGTSLSCVTDAGGWSAVDATTTVKGIVNVPAAGGLEVTSGAIGLPDVITGGTYTKVTVDDKGRVTTGANITGSDITSGTIGGSTSISTTGSISAASMSVRQIDLYDSDNTHHISFLTPATADLTTDYDLVFPSTLGASNQVLGMNNAGTALENKSITAGTGVTITHTAGGIEIAATGSGGTVTGVTGTSPISVDNTDPAAPVISISDAGTAGTYGSSTEVPVFTTDAKGRVTSVTETTISGVSPVGSSLATGQAWIGDGSGEAQARFIGIADLKTSIAGNASQIPTTCTASQTMTYLAVTDVFSCTNISITASQVSDLSTELSDYVEIAGDTMTGALNLPSNGLVIGTNQLVVSGGNIGIGTSTPDKLLTLKGSTNVSQLHFAGSGTPNAGGFLTSMHDSNAILAAGAEFNGTDWTARATSTSAVGLSAGDTVIYGATGLTVGGSFLHTELLRVKSTGDVGIGTTDPSAKLDVVGTIQIANGGETCSAAADGGMIRYNGGNLQFCNESSWQTLGVSGAGLTSLNGQTGSTQTFATPGTTGTAPNWSSATNAHTLNIPMASASGVTAGLLSKTDYDSFSAKQSSSLTSANILVGNSSNVATARSLSGDATLSNTGVLTLKNTGTAGSYGSATQVPVITTDAQGRVTAVTETTISGISPVGSSLTSTNIWVGNASNQAAAVAMSGDATMSNLGVLTLKNTGTAGTYTKVTTDAQGRITSGSNPTTLSGYGITDSITNAGGTVSIQSGLASSRPVAGTVGRVYFAADTKEISRDNGASWDVIASAAGSGGTVTSVSGTSPISVATGTTTAVVSLDNSGVTAATYGSATQVPVFTVDAKGRVTAVTNTTITGTSPVGSSLADGSVWIGDSSGNAQARSLSGDVAITNAGVTTVEAIQGIAVSATDPTAAGQVLKYDGTTDYDPGFITVSDLRSSINNANNLFPVNCTASQTLVHNAVTDQFDCTTITYTETDPKMQTLTTAEVDQLENIGTNTISAAQWGYLSGLTGTPLTSSTAFIQNGNSFGAAAVLGTNDGYDLSFETSGTRKMSILANGNVGIGTTNPDEQLEVGGDIKISANTSNFIFESSPLGTNNFTLFSNISDSVNGNFQVRNNGTSLMTFLPSGNVGIGTTNPSQELEVAGAALIKDANSNYVSLGGGLATGNKGLGIYYDNTNDAGRIQAVHQGTAYKSLLLNASGGNVGIGTTTPNSNLEVAGSTSASIYITDKDAVKDSAGIGASVQFRDSANSLLGLMGYSTSVTEQLTIANRNDDGDIAFQTGGSTERMRIDASGNVGIGTTTPAAGLHITSAPSSGTAYGVSIESKATSNAPSTVYGLYSAPSYTYNGGGMPPMAPAIVGIYSNPAAGGTGSASAIFMGGNVGIGTDVPKEKLAVYNDVLFDTGTSAIDGYRATLHLSPLSSIGTATDGAYGGAISFGGIGNSRRRSAIANVQTGPDVSYGGLAFFTTSAASTTATDNVAERMRIDYAGNVGIGITNPSHILHINGQGRSTNSAWATTSDIRLKDIQGDYEYGLEEILKLHTVWFNYKKDNPLSLPSNKTYAGIIAQELQKVIPEAVEETSDGYLTVNADPVQWAAINAIKDLYGVCKMSDEQIQRHEREISSLKEEIQSLRSENQMIKAWICQKDSGIPFCQTENL